MTKKSSPVWHKSTVLGGNKIGRTLGFPTINLDPLLFPVGKKEGVYAALVKHKNTTYKGALFFGPRLVLGETKKVLEIFILDFNQEIYDQTAKFQIKNFIREVQHFSSLKILKRQLKKDIVQIKTLLS